VRLKDHRCAQRASSIGIVNLPIIAAIGILNIFSAYGGHRK
jgi:hypothetical protein